MKVVNAFNKEVRYIGSESTLLDAAKFIFGHHHKGIPVINKAKKVIGFITEQDIMAQMFPSEADLMEDYVHERDFEAMEKNLANVLTKKVKKVMSKNVITIHKDDPLLKAESIMKLKDISRLPVIDDKGVLIGIISKGDIFRALVSRKIRGFK